ncbi:MAG: hypothetical protein WB586_28665 [Chthoniobacterales bacterium]
MKTDDPLHGDFLGFISVYSFCHALFVRLKDVFELTPIISLISVSEQLNRRRRDF